jgi:hypothetical protein
MDRDAVLTVDFSSDRSVAAAATLPSLQAMPARPPYAPAE